MTKKRILLKITGNVFLSKDKKTASIQTIQSLIAQLKQLVETHQFCIVIGGGNFFRGSEFGKQLGITESVGHHVGMLATMMNGLILSDLFQQAGIATKHLSAIVAPGTITPARQDCIDSALSEQKTIIFSGGTGIPFFTTDTNAVVRALQVDADEIWKASAVNGIYDKNPHKYNDAKLLKTINFKDIVEKNIQIMDRTAFTLAHSRKKIIRVFNIFEDNGLLKAAKDPLFGSTVR